MAGSSLTNVFALGIPRAFSRRNRPITQLAVWLGRLPADKRNMKSITRVLGFAMVMGAASVSSAQTAHISGTVSYHERMALPASAIVEVRLDDVTRAGGTPPVVALTMVEQPGQVPIKFELPYETRKIAATGRYAVRATISDGGTVLFTSLDTVLVLTQGHGTHADLVLTRVANAAGAVAAPPAPPAPPLAPNPLMNLPATFVGTLPCADCDGIRYQLNLFADDSFVVRMMYIGRSVAPVDDMGSWALSSDRRVLVLKGQGATVDLFGATGPGVFRKLDADGQPIPGKVPYEITRASALRPLPLHLTMRGAYTYTADAANFVECSTGQHWPVAPGVAAKDLESAYLKTRPEPGAAVLAEIEGTVFDRPRVDGPGQLPTLSVDKMIRLLPRETCAPRFTSAPLMETEWRLVKLGDRVITPATDTRRALSLTFQEADAPAGGGMSGSYAGSSGCNRVIGTYTIANGALTLTSGGTAIACRDDAATEAAFVAALKSTRSYRIVGRSLELMDESGARIARFDARVPAGITVR
jgi:uncharacterized lipoprotein YbaY/uncharacterized lipoprotein NlpE involved in copper resistance